LNAWFDKSVVDYESEDAAPRFNYRKLAGGKRIVSEDDYKSKNKKSPDYYFKHNLFFTIETEERELPEAMELFGATQFLFATDYPHDDPGGRMKFKDVELLDNNREISAPDKDLLRYKNAERLLATAADRV
jgi:predicted TIM-barrel fold metal-dependent hydrolase